MTTTLENLPGEGEVQTITKVRQRKTCEICGEFAHFKHSYLLENYRNNPSSTAFRKDDCSWCSDVDVFTCLECQPETPEGCDSGRSTFPANERFAHMFLEWVVQD